MPPRTLALLIMLIAPALTAGCLDDVGDRVRSAFASCPDDVAAVDEGVPAPVWAPGDAWSFAVHDAWNATPESRLGMSEWRVQGCVVENGALAYAVRVSRPGWGTRVQHFDAHDLNEVWDVCGEPGVMGDCEGRMARWDFPITENKTWTYWCCGDTLDEFDVRVDVEPNATLPPAAGGGTGTAWRITAERTGAGPLVEIVDVYAPQVGLFVEHVEIENGTLRERWLLANVTRS